MMTQKLNDREEQTLLSAAFYFLQHVNFWSKGKKYHPVNPYDILSPGHTKAHLITAIQKLSGQPISHAFQNPSTYQVEKTLQIQQNAIREIRMNLLATMSAEKADELLNFATLQN